MVVMQQLGPETDVRLGRIMRLKTKQMTEWPVESNGINTGIAHTSQLHSIACHLLSEPVTYLVLGQEFW